MKKMSTGKRIVAWVFQIATAAILFNASIMKFMARPQAVEIFTAIDMEPYGRIMIGILEMLSAVLLVIPHGIIYGAFIALGVMTGAVIGHLTSLGIEGLQMAGIVFFNCGFIIYLRRHESSMFRHMFNR